jgi:hypothetical protein
MRKKRIGFAAAIMTLVLSGWLFPPMALSKESGQLLTCRGGQHIFLSLAPSQKGTLIEVGFMKGSKPGNDGVEPGTCAWPERAMGDNDARIVSYFAEGFFVKVTLNKHLSSYQANRFGPETEASELLQREIQYWLDAIREEREFMIYVQPGGSVMPVTRIGP